MVPKRWEEEALVGTQWQVWDAWFSHKLWLNVKKPSSAPLWEKVQDEAQGKIWMPGVYFIIHTWEIS